MNTAKQIAIRLLDEVPDEMMKYIVSYIAFIKNSSGNKIFRELEEASISSTDFWNNPSDENNLLTIFDTLGKWEDSKDTDTIIKEIEGSRTSRKADIVL